MINEKIELDDAEAKAALGRLYLALRGQLGDPMREIGRTLKTSTQFRFRDQVGPDGRRWIKSRRAEKDHGQTLRKTGRLRNSITYLADDVSVEIGTNVVYAPALQFGVDKEEQVKTYTRRVTMAWGRPLNSPVTATVRAHARRMKLVARPFIGASQQDRRDILAIVGRHLFRAVGVELPGAGE